jgi:hypothetical protein
MLSIISQFTLFCNKILNNNSIFRKLFWTLFFFCFSVSSFFLGRLSKIFESVPETSLEFTENSNQITTSSFPNTESIQNKNGYTIVASKLGKKYYFLWCSASNNIKASNKIYFKTEDDAKKRGLSLAGNCK